MGIIKRIEKKVAEEREKLRMPKRKRTFGQKASDWVAKWLGSWIFIIIIFIFMTIWVWVNVYMVIFRWDPYPFILFNLVLSCLAAVQAPIILMSQNRQADRDRFKAELDYRINKKAEAEIEDMQKDLEQIKELIRDLDERIKK